MGRFSRPWIDFVEAMNKVVEFSLTQSRRKEAGKYNGKQISQILTETTTHFKVLETILGLH